MRKIYLLMSAILCGALGVLAHAGPQQAPSVIPPEFQFLFRDVGVEPKDLPVIWAALPYDSITLERSNCMSGGCPAYQVTLHRGASADRFGHAEAHVSSVGLTGSNALAQFPERRGDFTGRIYVRDYARLCYLLRQSQFSNLRNDYSTLWSDLRTATVTTVTGGKTKTVVDYGDMGPIELWGVEEGIDSIAKSIAWTPKR